MEKRADPIGWSMAATATAPESRDSAPTPAMLSLVLRGVQSLSPDVRRALLEIDCSDRNFRSTVELALGPGCKLARRG